MRAYELIKKKRDGGTLSAEEIRGFLHGYTTGEVPEYQMAAMCMAIFFRGLSSEELAAWTHAMLHSGEVVDLCAIPGVKIDKHSTGGVGDKVSLALAPLAVACGVRVPMVSGRGLGHTGGTLDKLEAIPGFRVDLSVAHFRRQIAEVGACLIGQTAHIAPADRKLYALRDVTATVDCIPLIASSILSKKLAEGIDGLVLDVKVGSGAFMKTRERARELAQTMVGIGRAVGKKVVALLTDMSQPLGRTVGNALETIEAIELLKGKGPEDLVECTRALTARMLMLAGVEAEEAAARARVDAAIADGSGLRAFAAIVEAQGGDPRVLSDPGLFARARAVIPVPSPATGYVTAIDCEALGLAAVALGAGRARVEDKVDPAVGFVVEKKLGHRVVKGEPLVLMHVNDRERAPSIEARVRAAYAIGPEPVTPPPVVLECVE